MPGFSIKDDTVQYSKDNKAEFRRKHRWRVAAGDNPIMTDDEFLYLKSAARPNFKFQEAEFHHDQEKAYLAGKQEWDPIELVFYDAVGGGDRGGAVPTDMAGLLYEWVVTVCNLDAATCGAPNEYKKTLIIQSTDAQGEVDETWTLYGAWPVTTNWNNLDYTANEIQEVNVSVRYDRALRS